MKTVIEYNSMKTYIFLYMSFKINFFVKVLYTLTLFMALVTCSHSEHVKTKISPATGWKKTVLNSLELNKKKINKCYQQALQKRKSLQGLLVMQWNISLSGKGKNAKAIKNRTGSKALEDCVAGVLENIDFTPHPQKQISKIHFPFQFSLPK